jgi:hypothetical protein
MFNGFDNRPLRSLLPKSGVKIALASRLDRFQVADPSKDVIGQRLKH